MMKKNEASLCKECEGKGAIACPACHGQGRQPSSNAVQRPCPSCHGKGTSVCPSCRGAKRVAEGK
jgi:DnaJ-class molecular chaperone